MRSVTAPIWLTRRVLDRELRGDKAEHARILTHELFHFVWVRLGNAKRRAWEDLVRAEWRARTPGEAGWSAEWRKGKLTPRDPRDRTRLWREYCSESFCDTAACLHTGTRREVTLARKPLAARGIWFTEQLGKSIPI